MRVDFHVHSSFSFDSYMTPRHLLRAAEKKGLDAITITDHDNMDVYDELKKHNNYGSKIQIIPGCEFKTEYGDIIGIFIDKIIQYKDPVDLVQKIRAQGGVIIIPHLFDNKKMDLSFVKKHAKIIETLNSRIRKANNYKALNFAKKEGLFCISGSDAHSSFEIGRVYNVFKCTTLKEIRQKLLEGDFIIEGTENNRLLVFISKLIGTYKKNGLFMLLRKILTKVVG